MGAFLQLAQEEPDRNPTELRDGLADRRKGWVGIAGQLSSS